jgi:hypothetical protein
VTQKFTPREAMSAAKRLGWEVKPKKASGAISFRAPTGESFTCAAPGRADRVPLMLAKALEEAIRTDEETA